MAEYRGDQAEGLRRMLERDCIGNGHPARIINLASGCTGVGKTSVAVNLAALFAGRGLRVLLIDENRGPANISALFGLAPPAPDPVTRRARGLEDALLRMANGVTLLAAASAWHEWPALPATAREELLTDWRRIERRFDVVLVDTLCAAGGGADLFAGKCHDTIVVSSAAPHAVTASYALIKRWRGAASEHRFHLLLNRVAVEANARVILENLAGVARSHLQTPVASLGCIPKDESLRIANAGCRPVVEAHPWSPSAARLRGIADCIAGWPGHHRQHWMDRFMARVVDGGRPVLAPAGV